MIVWVVNIVFYEHEGCDPTGDVTLAFSSLEQAQKALYEKCWVMYKGSETIRSIKDSSLKFFRISKDKNRIEFDESEDGDVMFSYQNEWGAGAVKVIVLDD